MSAADVAAAAADDDFLLQMLQLKMMFQVYVY